MKLYTRRRRETALERSGVVVAGPSASSSRGNSDAIGFPLPIELFPVCVRWANLDTFSRIIITNDLQMRWLNVAAASLLEQNDGLYERDGHLRFASPSSEQNMLASVRSAQRQMSHVCLPSVSTGHFLIRLRRIENDGDDPLIGLTINSCSPDLDVRLADLKNAYGLTAAEQEIVRLLHAGLVAERIATSLSLSLQTIRSHIRSAYQKLDVTSREALFRKLAPYRL